MSQAPPPDLQRVVKDLFDRYHRYVMAVCQRVAFGMGCRCSPEALAGDVWCAVCEAVAGGRFEAKNPQAWLGVVARNTTIKHHRQQHREQLIEQDVMQETIELRTTPAKDSRQDDLNMCRQHFLDLHDADVEALDCVLKYSAEHCAATTGRTLNAIYLCFKRAKKKLRECVERRQRTSGGER